MTTAADRRFDDGASVGHPRHGSGRVVADLSDTVVVQFDGGLHRVPAEELVAVSSLDAVFRERDFGDPVDAVVRAQALAIGSVNDQWGVFSRSRVRLLPHQLWVCRTVNRKWPFRWLVADDVGLGKTIECGLVLMPLIASGRVRRLLILAPAKLVPQWQFRLKDMFDVRLQRYLRQADTAYGDFWGTAFQVVASFHTLRREGRARERLLESDPWDLVVVDEAHHLGIDQRARPTLAYDLIADLERRGKINSLLFFTGTPHRGKDFGFFGLMHLVRPDLFDPEKDSVEQLTRLPLAMIRNNKEAVTDLQGNRLFQPVTVNNREYAYSEEEARFYQTLSEFIIDGRAYAATLDGRAQTARMLVLTTLQKLAASSIASIRQALRKRRERLEDIVEFADQNREAAVNLPDDEQATLDEVAEAEENLPGAAAVVLMQDEIGRLGELIALSENVTVETKVERLVALISEELPAGEPVLLFTEYKATQALIVNTLHRRYGYGTAAFINGDDRLDGVAAPSGEIRSVSQAREGAAAAFNAGGVRFLVSTEAGGEGIDLQERCAVLVHADMPWNPMRLHQRVGRLSRYGQERPVSVYILRNPDTVEARIWDLLNEKLARVQQALDRVMEQPEDISQLVVGMAGSALFNRLYSGAEGMTGERLAGWFDTATATLGGQDVVDTVRDMLGSVSRFDFQQVGRDLPQVDVPDLEPFFRRAVGRHGRRVFKHDDGLEIRAPDAWKDRHYAVRDKHEGLVFDRGLRGAGAAARVLGVGHTLFDVALAEARDLPVRVAALDGLLAPMLILAVEDEVTDTGAAVRRLIFGVTDGADGPATMRDWELLRLLNGVPVRASDADAEPGTSADEMTAAVERLKRAFDSRLADHAPAFRRPTSWPEMLLVPRPDTLGAK